MDIEGHEPDAFKGMDKLLHERGNFAVMFEFHVGLLKAQSFSFAESLFTIPGTHLYSMDSRNRTMQKLTPRLLQELIEKASKAQHPFNLYNLLLISDSLVDALPNLTSGNPHSHSSV
jgi:hypothetical protein